MARNIFNIRSAGAFRHDALRQRVGEQVLETLLQETLAAAHRGGALSVKAREAVAVDTTVEAETSRRGGTGHRSRQKRRFIGTNWLGGRTGDRSNALLAAVGFNLRQLLRFLKRTNLFFRSFLHPLLAACPAIAVHFLRVARRPQLALQ